MIRSVTRYVMAHLDHGQGAPHRHYWILRRVWRVSVGEPEVQS